MAPCNATLTTVTVTPCPSAGQNVIACLYDPARPTRWLLCEWGVHHELHTLTCDGPASETGGFCETDTLGNVWHESADSEIWMDSTPGAIPHKPTSTVVTNAEVAAVAYWWQHNAPVGPMRMKDFHGIAQAAADAREAGGN